MTTRGGTIIEPLEDWEYLACPVCRDVDQFRVDRRERMVWCDHLGTSEERRRSVRRVRVTVVTGTWPGRDGN